MRASATGRGRSKYRTRRNVRLSTQPRRQHKGDYSPPPPRTGVLCLVRGTPLHNQQRGRSSKRRAHAEEIILRQKGLVKKSARLSTVLTYGTRSCVFFTHSRMSNCRRSITYAWYARVVQDDTTPRHYNRRDSDGSLIVHVPSRNGLGV